MNNKSNLVIIEFMTRPFENSSVFRLVVRNCWQLRHRLGNQKLFIFSPCQQKVGTNKMMYSIQAYKKIVFYAANYG